MQQCLDGLGVARVGLAKNIPDGKRKIFFIYLNEVSSTEMKKFHALFIIFLD